MNYISFLHQVNLATDLNLTLADGYKKSEYNIPEWHIAGSSADGLMLRVANSYKQTLAIGDDGIWHPIEQGFNGNSANEPTIDTIISAMKLKNVGTITDSRNVVYNYYCPVA